jgi:hypothetical protein
VGLRILGTDIAGIVARALGGGALSGTLHSVSRGTRSAAALAGGTNPTYSDHAFKGFSESLSRSRMPESVVAKARRAVLVLGDTVSPAVAPKSGDQLTFEGERGHVLTVERDPDAAAYLCLLRE